MESHETTVTLIPEQTRGDGAGDPSRARRLLSTASAKVAQGRAAVPGKVRQAGTKVSTNWVPTVAGALALAGATTAVILRRRRAAQAQAARNRWRPGFLQR